MTEKVWRLIVDGEKSPAANMANDENMLEICRVSKVPVLRFYKWNVPTLSLGYFQNINEVDLANCHAHNVAVIRRPTGGRAVLHKEELTYSIAMHKSYLPGTLLETYKELSAALALGLQQLGLPAVITSGKKKMMANTAACFDAPSSYELTVLGRKIIGSAQTRRGDILLQHGSIPIYNHNELLLQLLNLPDSKRAALGRVLERNAGSIMDFKPILPIDSSRSYTDLLPAIEEALLEGFKLAFAIDFAPRPLTVGESMAVEKLIVSKYGLDSWNLERRSSDA